MKNINMKSLMLVGLIFGFSQVKALDVLELTPVKASLNFFNYGKEKITTGVTSITGLTDENIQKGANHAIQFGLLYGAMKFVPSWLYSMDKLAYLKMAWAGVKSAAELAFRDKTALVTLLGYVGYQMYAK